MRVCLESRETEVASFLRRHLTPSHIAEIRHFFGGPGWDRVAGSEEVFNAHPLSMYALNAGAALCGRLEWARPTQTRRIRGWTVLLGTQ
jgi:hypothetical protein